MPVLFLRMPAFFPEVSFPMQGFPKTHGKIFRSAAAFSLIELLVVIAIILIMSALAVPVMNSLRGAGDLTTAAYDVAGILERARAHALAHNTHVWVGFYEENAGTTAPTSTLPAYPGKGQVVVGTVASLDGTRIFPDGATAATLPASRLTAVDKIVKIQNLHLMDVGTPAGGDSKTLNGRPAEPYSDDNNRISSESADKTPFPFTIQDYTFSKTIRFSPRGEASINGQDLKRIAEIGLRPTRGSVVDLNTPNVAAVQFSGISGNVQIYRP